jgi:hypothetical protein
LIAASAFSIRALILKALPRVSRVPQTIRCGERHGFIAGNYGAERAGSAISLVCYNATDCYPWALGNVAAKTGITFWKASMLICENAGGRVWKRISFPNSR